MKRAKFSSKQKLDIVLSYLSSIDSVTNICEQNNISRTVLHEWVNLLKSRHEWIFRHEKKLHGLSRAHQTVLNLREENSKLRQRLGEMDFDEGTEWAADRPEGGPPFQED